MAGALDIGSSVAQGAEPARSIMVELAGEPQGKGRPRFSRQNGRAFTPAATRSYEAALRLAAQEAMGEQPLLTGALMVEIVAAMPIPLSMSKRDRAKALAGDLRPTKKPDLDNILKNLDALNQVVFADDKQIVTATASKFYSARPALRIVVREVA